MNNHIRNAKSSPVVTRRPRGTLPLDTDDTKIPPTFTATPSKTTAPQKVAGVPERIDLAELLTDPGLKSWQRETRDSDAHGGRTWKTHEKKLKLLELIYEEGFVATELLASDVPYTGSSKAKLNQLQAMVNIGWLRIVDDGGTRRFKFVDREQMEKLLLLYSSAEVRALIQANSLVWRTVSRRSKKHKRKGTYIPVGMKSYFIPPMDWDERGSDDDDDGKTATPGGDPVVVPEEAFPPEPGQQLDADPRDPEAHDHVRDRGESNDGVTFDNPTSPFEDGTDRRSEAIASDEELVTGGDDAEGTAGRGHDQDGMPDAPAPDKYNANHVRWIDGELAGLRFDVHALEQAVTRMEKRVNIQEGRVATLELTAAMAELAMEALTNERDMLSGFLDRLFEMFQVPEDDHLAVRFGRLIERLTWHGGRPVPSLDQRSPEAHSEAS